MVGTITGVRGDDGENEWRQRLLGDVEQVIQQRSDSPKYVEMSITAYDNIIGGTPYPNGQVKVQVCVDCGSVVFWTKIHDERCK